MTQTVAFPSGSTADSPATLSAQAIRSFGRGRYDAIRAEIREMPPDAYVRVGVDRALAIAIDIAGLQPQRRYTILVAGCGSGLVAELLSSCGYEVTSVDVDSAPRSGAGPRISQRRINDVSDGGIFDVGLLCSEWDNLDVAEMHAHIGSHLYFETSDSDTASAVSKTNELLNEGSVRRTTWIATSIDPNGKPRRLYRADLR